MTHLKNKVALVSLMRLIHSAADFSQLTTLTQAAVSSFRRAVRYLSAPGNFLALILLALSAAASANHYDKYQNLQGLQPSASVDFEAYGQNLQLRGQALPGNLKIICWLHGECLVRSLDGHFADFRATTPSADFLAQLQFLPVGANFVFYLNQEQ